VFESLYITFRLALGPPSHLLNGCRGSFPGIKRPKHEGGSPSSAEGNNDWSCITSPFIYHHGMPRENVLFAENLSK
jgi:hypothetical protein